MNRFWLALRAFWRILTEPDFAARVEPLFREAPTGPDLRVLAVLQRDGRLVDFLEEDIDGYSDAQIGAAVRDIHRGCRKSLHDYLTIEPIIDAAEEAAGDGPSRFRPGRDPAGRQRQRLAPVPGRPQASWLAGPSRSISRSCRWRATTRRCSRRPRSRSPDAADPAAVRMMRRSLDTRTRQRTQTHGMSRYVVGIDLGTTNCALAYADASAIGADQPGPIASLPIPQVVAVNDVSERPLLPSFLYLPSAKEFPAGALDLPWKSPPDRVVGVFARDHGAKVPGRLVSSAKSWLSHAGVDRRAAILPWTAAEDVSRISPVAASAAYLEHLRDAWNARIAGKTAADRLENQDVFLTVPASFDAVARELTIEAAAKAGLKHVTLLEEPQAAFYAWLAAQGDKWRKKVKVGDIILVCDVGGGTTDFTLIAVSDEGGDLVLSRLAVGEHILLGGDNMDLALAYAVAATLAPGDGGPRRRASGSRWDTPAAPPRKPCSPT